ncbi:glycosyltransferase 87 family protein [Microlunatus sp. Y2014]|uniref:glycosyltransferase 87 family protein n=1 Tax=Microlunatus sp. Y2014 TaxID=3418488 RepID=UPI003DA746EE
MADPHDAAGWRASRPARWAWSALCAIAVFAPVALVSLFVSSSTFSGATFRPWKPRMIDLDVYRKAGEAVVTGGNPYALEGLPFLYPPFAAVVFVPLALVPPVVMQVGWVLLNAAALLGILHHLGMRGWRLSLAACVITWAVMPVAHTLSFGQLGTFLVYLVVRDLVPRRPAPGAGEDPHPTRRHAGWLTGLATALKLSPGLFIVHLVVGRRRAALVAIGTILLTMVIGFVVMPQAALDFWLRLVTGGDALDGQRIFYYTNQSVSGTATRVLGNTGAVRIGALVVSAVVAVVALLAARRWHRRGEQALAICLVGVGTLIAAPASWMHHFVWIVPLAVVLWRNTAVPDWFRLGCWAWCAWVAASPFLELPTGGDTELSYSTYQNLLAGIGTVAGIVLLVAALVCRPRIDTRYTAPMSATKGDDA